MASNRGPSAYQPNTLLLSQTSSRLKLFQAVSFITAHVAYANSNRNEIVTRADAPHVYLRVCFDALLLASAALFSFAPRSSQYQTEGADSVCGQMQENRIG